MRPYAIGLSIDDLWLRLGVSLDSDHGESIESRPLAAQNSFPNAILLPRNAGEPFRFDLGSVPHPRGSGLLWPNDAQVGRLNGSGRLPIGSILHSIGDGNRVQWRFEDNDLSCSCTDALAGALSELYRGEAPPFVLVIPNHWKVELQQAVLDSFQKENLKCRLLWRPVAAALEWTNVFGDQTKELPGKLLSIYLGYGDIEMTELDLVNWNTKSGSRAIVPGRKRPRTFDRFPSFGFRQIIDELSTEPLGATSSLFQSGDRFSFIWNLLWCRQHQARFLSSHRFKRHSHLRVDTGTEFDLCHAAQATLSEVVQHILGLRAKFLRVYQGIVVSGPLANSVFDDNTTVLQSLLTHLDVTSSRILVEGRDVDSGLLARGAYRFAHCLEKGLTTYLDTLPRLEMVILEKGEATWIDLLKPEQEWVEGGQEWKRPEPVGNMSIPPNSVDLKIAVAHEDFENVREVVTEIPATTNAIERVSLSVQMTPAQGNARIEITPQNNDLFGDKRVFIDWRHMTVFKTEDGQPATKEGYINSLPRIFPELLPRICSSTRMQKVRPVLLRIREAITTGQKRSVVNQYFAEARELLREKDQSMYPEDATAFDSEGMCCGSFDIQAFMDIAWPYFLKCEPDEFVRAIAYTHVDHQQFQDFVAKHLQARNVNVGVIIAAGKCLRSQSHIALFTKSFLNQLHSGQAKMDWWKALSEILRFRGDATQPMTSSDCIEIIKGAGQVFHRERVRGTAKQLFRTACIVIVYILRRRAFDDTFLPPESDLAIWIKSEFRQARSDSKAGKLRLMGGSVDLSSQLQLIIDYVDRQGKGQLLIGD